MAFRELQSLDADQTIALGGVNRKTGKKNPTQVEGYYLGSRQVDGSKGKAVLHFLQTPKGNLGVWGKTDLDRKLSNVTPGAMIRATHVGMQATPKGEMYKYKVEVDQENTIEVSDSLNQNTEDSLDDSSPSEDEASYYRQDEDDEVEDFAGTPPATPQASALVASAAERKAKVQALLSKNKKA